MEKIYVVQGTFTGLNGEIVHQSDSAYTDKKEAINRSRELNRCTKYEKDPNYLAYVVGPIPLDYSIKKLGRPETRSPKLLYFREKYSFFNERS